MYLAGSGTRKAVLNSYKNMATKQALGNISRIKVWVMRVEEGGPLSTMKAYGAISNLIHKGSNSNHWWQEHRNDVRIHCGLTSNSARLDKGQRRRANWGWLKPQILLFEGLGIGGMTGSSFDGLIGRYSLMLYFKEEVSSVLPSLAAFNS